MKKILSLVALVGFLWTSGCVAPAQNKVPMGFEGNSISLNTHTNFRELSSKKPDREPKKVLYIYTDEFDPRIEDAVNFSTHRYNFTEGQNSESFKLYEKLVRRLIINENVNDPIRYLSFDSKPESIVDNHIPILDSFHDDIEMIHLGSGSNLIDILSKHKNIDVVITNTHGSYTILTNNTPQYTVFNISDFREENFVDLSENFNPGAEILLNACETDSQHIGNSTAKKIAMITGAKVHSAREPLMDIVLSLYEPRFTCRLAPANVLQGEIINSNVYTPVASGFLRMARYYDWITINPNNLPE